MMESMQHARGGSSVEIQSWSKQLQRFAKHRPLFTSSGEERRVHIHVPCMFTNHLQEGSRRLQGLQRLMDDIEYAVPRIDEYSIYRFFFSLRKPWAGSERLHRRTLPDDSPQADF